MAKLYHSGDITFADGVKSQFLGDFVEKIVMNHIMDNHKELISLVYPELLDLDTVKVWYLRPYPMQLRDKFSQLSPGTIISPNFKHSSKCVNLDCLMHWHGDLAIIVDGIEHGKMALIFEIKYGGIHITKGQHAFFQQITKHPENHMHKLTRAKVVIVHAYKLDLDKRSLHATFREYVNGHPEKDVCKLDTALDCGIGDEEH